MTLPVGSEINGYRIEALLSSGGMGAVYRATQLSVDREVALKTLLNESTNQHLIDRFKQEARVLARVNHPHVVQVLDLREEGELLFIAMELVSGMDLSQRLRDLGPLDESVAREYLRQSASALAAAHEKGIIHRDIKPSNLMLTTQGIIKVADFGIAKSSFVETNITMAGALLGTPDYMPPEQVDGDVADVRSDIYALGASFYHLLSGHPPFKGKTYTDILVAHKTQTPTPLIDIAKISQEFSDLVQDCLNKVAGDRPQSMHEIITRCDQMSLNHTSVTVEQDIPLPIQDHLRDLALIEFVARERKLSRQRVEEALAYQRAHSSATNRLTLEKVLIDQSYFSKEDLLKISSQMDHLKQSHDNETLLKIIEKNDLLEKGKLDALESRQDEHGLSMLALLERRQWLSHKQLKQLKSALIKIEKTSFDKAIAQLILENQLVSEENLEQAINDCQPMYLVQHLLDEQLIKQDELRAILDVQKHKKVEHAFTMDLFDSNIRLRDQLICPHCQSQVFSDEVVCRTCKGSLKVNAQKSDAHVEQKPVVGIPWFIQVAGGQKGPLQFIQLQKLALAGKLKSSHKIRSGAKGNWQSPQEICGLARVFGLCYKCGNLRSKEAGACELCEAVEP